MTDLNVLCGRWMRWNFSPKGASSIDLFDEKNKKMCSIKINEMIAFIREHSYNKNGVNLE